MALNKQVSPADYKRVFEEMAGGPQVLDELTRRFGRAAYVPGGAEGDRETCYRAGQRSVLDFILMQINRADGVNDDVED
ncbi:TPA: hypothetical protein QDZ66_000625 [Pluralibacter gergoviae]|uniref:Bbp19 family protein n=1 Tax=Pluralibacter gergoviae TaxID=61647 RepID=UPI0006524230|nr:hypothetical protein [Pluralibacter gergoviae]KMK17752.1 hypothetical protein ABW10_24815 [Pluralibacter gergoviae]MBL3694248.1 hypothetical protein [Pluralibacter gergoviae]HDS1149910.1 hypothetical protein [Pluralibacter gergoviae]